MKLSRVLAASSLMLALSTPALAKAADPIMQLGDVRAGMQCTGLSVIRGTAVTDFRVEILDVLRTDVSSSGPRLLIRVSGPAIEATGIGPGFSGSPIYCADAAGVQRNVGAISEGIGEYGNDVGLATPIEEILGRKTVAPATARNATALMKRANPIATPLTVTGLSGPMRRAAIAGARKAGATLLAAPSGPLVNYPPYPLVPGTAVTGAISSGDVALGAIGTVTYRDGDRLWAFGHPLDAYGKRSLPLLDAYVFTVINNPLGFEDAITYKLAAPGRPVGTLTNDTLSAIVGRIGAPPKLIPLTVFARDLASGRTRTLRTNVSDERKLGLGSGLDLVTTLAVGQAASEVLRAAPPRLTASLCLRVKVRQAPKRLGFCKRYFDGQGPLDDVSSALGLVDGYEFGPLDVLGASVRIGVREGLREAFMLRADAPRRVRPGQRIRIRLQLQRSRAGRERVSFMYRVPRSTRPGKRTLTLRGNVPQSVENGAENVIELLLGGAGSGPRPPRSVPELAARIRALGRPVGLRASFSSRNRGPVVYRNDRLLIRGKVSVPMIVTGRSSK